MTNQICSKCHEDIMNCKCENFHPNLEPIVIIPITWSGEPILIGKEEATKLYQYFLKVGYISYEDYPEVHSFVERLRRFIS